MNSMVRSSTHTCDTSVDLCRFRECEHTSNLTICEVLMRLVWREVDVDLSPLESTSQIVTSQMYQVLVYGTF